jgi:hypothetical protein
MTTGVRSGIGLIELLDWRSSRQLYRLTMEMEQMTARLLAEMK